MIDFQSMELVAIIDHLAMAFDELPTLINDRPDFRILIKEGALV